MEKNYLYLIVLLAIAALAMETKTHYAYMKNEGDSVVLDSLNMKMQDIAEIKSKKINNMSEYTHVEQMQKERREKLFISVLPK